MVVTPALVWPPLPSIAGTLMARFLSFDLPKRANPGYREGRATTDPSHPRSLDRLDRLGMVGCRERPVIAQLACPAIRCRYFPSTGQGRFGGYSAAQTCRSPPAGSTVMSPGRGPATEIPASDSGPARLTGPFRRLGSELRLRALAAPETAKTTDSQATACLPGHDQTLPRHLAS